MSRSRFPSVQRDQNPTEFGLILSQLRYDISADVATLVDATGETVDYASCLDPFDTKIFGAELSILCSVVRESAPVIAGGLRGMCVRGNRASLVVYPLPEEYSLMLKLRRRSFFPPWRPVATALEKISKEAGFAMESGGHGGSWERTEVRTAIGTTIPLEIWRRGGWRAIEVMGRCREQDLGHKEQGFRIRTADAEELLLIREPLGIWYAET